jgi:hypothetical protein
MLSEIILLGHGTAMDATDLKLLELASMAAGEHFDAENSPLDRDDLALRLAVKLGIDISFMLANAVAQTITGIGEHDTVVETHEQLYPDACAATRRAIVRAAAAIATAKS